MAKIIYENGNLTVREKQIIDAIVEVFTAQTFHFSILVRSVNALQKGQPLPMVEEIVKDKVAQVNVDCVVFMNKYFPDIKARLIDEDSE